MPLFHKIFIFACLVCPSENFLLGWGCTWPCRQLDTPFGHGGWSVTPTTKLHQGVCVVTRLLVQRHWIVRILVHHVYLHIPKASLAPLWMVSEWGWSLQPYSGSGATDPLYTGRITTSSQSHVTCNTMSQVYWKLYTQSSWGPCQSLGQQASEWSTPAHDSKTMHQ